MGLWRGNSRYKDAGWERLGMRPLAFLAMVLGSVAATAAGAQTVVVKSLAVSSLLGEPITPEVSIVTLNQAAFAPKTGAPAVIWESLVSSK